MISIFNKITEIFNNPKFIELNDDVQRQENAKKVNKTMGLLKFRQFKREIIRQQKEKYGTVYTVPFLGATYRDCCNCIHQKGVGPEGSFITCKKNWGILRMKISKELVNQFKYEGYGLTFPCERFVKQSWIKNPIYTYPE